MQVDTSKLEVTWADKHVSTYSIQWLQEHSFNSKFQQQWLETTYRPQPIQWKANEFSSILKIFDFRDIINEYVIQMYNIKLSALCI